MRLGTLPVSFMLLCLLHLVHSNSYHLFDYISANFLQLKYNTSIMHSAVLSSITSCFAIVLCPIAGYVLDHTGYKSALTRTARLTPSRCILLRRALTYSILLCV